MPFFAKRSWPAPSIKERTIEAYKLVDQANNDKAGLLETINRFNHKKEFGEWHIQLNENHEVVELGTSWFELSVSEKRDYLQLWDESLQYRFLVKDDAVFLQRRNNKGVISVETARRPLYMIRQAARMNRPEGRPSQLPSSNQ